MFKANVLVTLRKSILDPQGKATLHALEHTGFTSVESVRLGKYIELWIDEEQEDAARQIAEQACRKVLANAVMEDFEVTLERLSPATAA